MKIKFSAIKWAIRVGYILAAYSVITFLVNYLPTDFLVTLSNLFTSEEEHIYYKLVTTEESKTYALVTLVLGVTLIVIGKLYAEKENT